MKMEHKPQFWFQKQPLPLDIAMSNQPSYHPAPQIPQAASGLGSAQCLANICCQNMISHGATSSGISSADSCMTSHSTLPHWTPAAVHSQQASCPPILSTQKHFTCSKHVPKPMRQLVQHFVGKPFLNCTHSTAPIAGFQAAQEHCQPVPSAPTDPTASISGRS